MDGLGSRTCILPQVRHLPLKRTFDIIFGIAALIFALPLLIIIAIAIKRTSPGKLLYIQERVGRAGKLFLCYKFRTMHSNADQILANLLVTDSKLRREWETKRKLSQDPRVTPFGRWLRKTSLDEFPQFWNVIKGDLSVVGPRPVTPEEVLTFYGPIAQKILSVRPGLTGIWQTSDRRHVTYEQRVAMDEKYVDTQSLRLDLLLILKTIPAMLRPRGAC